MDKQGSVTMAAGMHVLQNVMAHRSIRDPQFAERLGHVFTQTLHGRTIRDSAGSNSGFLGRLGHRIRVAGQGLFNPDAGAISGEVGHVAQLTRQKLAAKGIHPDTFTFKHAYKHLQENLPLLRSPEHLERAQRELQRNPIAVVLTHVVQEKYGVNAEKHLPHFLEFLGKAEHPIVSNIVPKLTQEVDKNLPNMPKTMKEHALGKGTSPAKEQNYRLASNLALMAHDPITGTVGAVKAIAGHPHESIAHNKYVEKMKGWLGDALVKKPLKETAVDAKFSPAGNVAKTFGLSAVAGNVQTLGREARLFTDRKGITQEVFGQKDSLYTQARDAAAKKAKEKGGK